MGDDEQFGIVVTSAEITRSVGLRIEQTVYIEEVLSVRIYSTCMVPLQSLLDELVGYISLIGFLLGVAVFVAICWSPFLLSRRFRQLFERLPPFESFSLTYGVVGVGAAVPYLLGLVTSLAVEDTGRALFTVVVIISVGYLVAIPLLGAVVLPRVGVDWDSTGYGLSTWALLVAGAIWYTALFAVPLTVISIVYSL